jgi:hypothetical protein
MGGYPDFQTFPPMVFSLWPFPPLMDYSPM